MKDNCKRVVEDMRNRFKLVVYNSTANSVIAGAVYYYQVLNLTYLLLIGMATGYF